MNIVVAMAAAVVALYTLRMIASTSWHTWRGSLVRFLAFSVAVACTLAGAVGVVFGVPWAPAILVIGAALYLLANRRGVPCNGSFQDKSHT